MPGEKGRCPKCNNPFQLPSRDDSCPGFADICRYNCEKCGEYIGTVRQDMRSDYPGFGCVDSDVQPGLGEWCESGVVKHD